MLIDEPGNAPVTPRNAGDTVGGPVRAAYIAQAAGP